MSKCFCATALKTLEEIQSYHKCFSTYGKTHTHTHKHIESNNNNNCGKILEDGISKYERTQSELPKPNIPIAMCFDTHNSPLVFYLYLPLYLRCRRKVLMEFISNKYSERDISILLLKHYSHTQMHIFFDDKPYFQYGLRSFCLQ